MAVAQRPWSVETENGTPVPTPVTMAAQPMAVMEGVLEEQEVVAILVQVLVNELGGCVLMLGIWAVRTRTWRTTERVAHRTEIHR